MALRTIPVILDIAREMRRTVQAVAPGARLIKTSQARQTGVET